MLNTKILLLIFGIISILLIIYFVPRYINKKENISLELDFYKDDISPVYSFPWNAIPELHEKINTMLDIYTTNLPQGDLYYLHDKIPEFKTRFDDADKNVLQLKKHKLQYYTNVETHLRDHTGKDSSRLILKKAFSHQLSDGKWRLNPSDNHHLSKYFYQDISGTFYYPPGGMKEWHTNRNSQNVPYWRLYFIYLTDPDTESYFCYINPITGKFHKMRDKHKTVNMFYLNNDQERLLWHSVKCIKGGRISFGLKLNPSQIPGLIERLNIKPQIG